MGFVIEKRGTAIISYAYDQFGRLTQKSKTGSRVANFYYNYGDQKRRSRSVSGGAMTKYRVDQGFGVVNEENSGGTLLSTYIHHPGRQIGTVLATSEGSTASSGTRNYYFQDAIGSTRSLWDEDGERLGKYDYTPFGGKYGNTGEEITRKFTGHDWDNEARLYHTAYRQYSPDTGRWLTRDPLGMVDGPNVYAYVVNNPVNWVDAMGTDLIDWIVTGEWNPSDEVAAAAYVGFLEGIKMGLWNAFDAAIPFADPNESKYRDENGCIAPIFLLSRLLVKGSLMLAASAFVWIPLQVKFASSIGASVWSSNWLVGLVQKQMFNAGLVSAVETMYFGKTGAAIFNTGLGAMGLYEGYFGFQEMYALFDYYLF